MNTPRFEKEVIAEASPGSSASEGLVDGCLPAGLGSALDAGFSRGAGLIGLVGAAGVGKSTSVRAWTAACGGEVRWTSLKDVSPAACAQALLACVADGVGGRSPAPAVPALMPVHQVIEQWRALARYSSPGLLCVVDDCEPFLYSDEGAALLDAIALEADTGIRFLLLSRLPGCLEALTERHADRVQLLEWDPDWPSADEVRAIAERMGTPAEQVSAVWMQECHGWLQGLPLITSLVGTANPAHLRERIHAHLVERMRSCKPFQEVEIALRICSVAGMVTASLLETLCPTVQLSQIAAAMSACEGFLRPQRRVPGVYELHPVFRRALYESLVQDFGLVNANQIQLTAAEILRREGFEFEAIVLMATGGDEPCALQLVEQLFSRKPVAERFGLWLQRNRYMPGEGHAAVWQSLWKRLGERGMATLANPSGFAPRLAAWPPHFSMGARLESWCRHLRLIQCENGTPFRLDAELEWFHAQPALIAEARTIRNPEALTTLTLLHVLRQPGAESTMLWQERSLATLLTQEPTPAHQGQLVLSALHLFLSRDRFRLEWMLDWWRHCGPSSATAKRLCSMLEAMVHLLAGDRDAALQAILCLAPSHDGPRNLPHHEAVLLAVCGWLGLEIPEAVMGEVRPRPGDVMNVMDCCFDVAKMNLLMVGAVRLGVAHADMVTGALQSGTRMEGVARFLDMSLHLAITQVHAFHRDAVAALERLAVFRSLPDAPERLELFADAVNLIEAYCQSLLEVNPENAREVLQSLEVRLEQTGAGGCVHPRLRERMVEHLQACLKAAALEEVDGCARAPAAFTMDTTPTPYAVEQAVMALEGDEQAMRVRVRTFGELSLTFFAAGSAVGKPLRLSKKLSRILRFLLLRGMKEPVQIDEICDEMWPHADGAAAKSNFDSAIHRLRHLLQSNKALLIEGGRVSVNRDYCCVDLDFLDKLMDVNIFHIPTAAVELVADKLLGMLSSPVATREQQPSGTDKIGNEVVDVLTTLVVQLTRRLGREGLHDKAARLYQCYTTQIKVDPGMVGAWKQLLLACGRGDEARCLTDRFGDVAIADNENDGDLVGVFPAAVSKSCNEMNITL